MILGNLQDSSRIEHLHPLLKFVFDYVKTHDTLSMAPGRIELDGEEMFINNDNPTLRTKEEQVIEVHRRYLDIHIPLDGKETFGWKPLRDLKEPVQAYDEKKDLALYADTPSTYFDIYPGQFVIAFPEDGHAPIIGEGRLRKLCVKIKL